MELSSHRTSNGYLVEELAAKQPLSIAFLRQYLVPSSVITRNVSSAQQQQQLLQKRKPSGTTLATVAAAAIPAPTSPGSTTPDTIGNVDVDFVEESFNDSPVREITRSVSVGGAAANQSDLMC